jgi:hypothetical protein
MTDEIKVFVAGTETAGKRCTICQTGIVAGEQIVYCPSCNLPFHQECWSENRGCSAYGCEAAPPTTKAATSPELTSNAWSGEKPCPACGRVIKSQALKCRFCGATFDTRDVIGYQEYAQREYEGKEYVAARNKVVAMFLGAAMGCLSPVALVFLGKLLFGGRVIGVEFKRLPGALRALTVAGFAIGSLLLILLILVLVLD